MIFQQSNGTHLGIKNSPLGLNQTHNLLISLLRKLEGNGEIFT